MAVWTHVAGNVYKDELGVFHIKRGKVYTPVFEQDGKAALRICDELERTIRAFRPMNATELHEASLQTRRHHNWLAMKGFLLHWYGEYAARFQVVFAGLMTNITVWDADGNELQQLNPENLPDDQVFGSLTYQLLMCPKTYTQDGDAPAEELIIHRIALEDELCALPVLYTKEIKL